MSWLFMLPIFIYSSETNVLSIIIELIDKDKVNNLSELDG